MYLISIQEYISNTILLPEINPVPSNKRPPVVQWNLALCILSQFDELKPPKSTHSFLQTYSYDQCSYSLLQPPIRKHWVIKWNHTEVSGECRREQHSLFLLGHQDVCTWKSYTDWCSSWLTTVCNPTFSSSSYVDKPLSVDVDKGVSHCLSANCLPSQL